MTREIRQHYHLTPPRGWMNDPNGLIYIDGTYHVFYQYHPFDTVWGPMHWGHAISRDLCLWQHLPIALTPHSDYDQMGCFSGTSLYENGILKLIYTGNTEQGQHQCLAFSKDLIHFEKYEGNPVLPASSLPDHINQNHLRDPRVIKESNVYYMLCGGQSIDNKGIIAIFKSLDLINWSYHFSINERQFELGPIWECPDLITLNDENAQANHLLIFSPQSTSSLNQYQMPNLHSAVYALGMVNFQNGESDFSQPRLLDEGFDFYAPQIISNTNDQVILIGWLDMWESENLNRKANLPWSGSMSYPRVLSLKEGRLIQQPVDSITQYRDLAYQFVGSVDLATDDQNRFPFEMGIFSTPCFDLTLEVSSNDSNESELKFTFTDSLSLVYSPKQQILRLHRGNDQRTVQLDSEPLSLRILSDVTSVEIYINGGEHVMSSKLLRCLETPCAKETDTHSLQLSGKGLWHFEAFELYTLKFDPHSLEEAK